MNAVTRIETVGGPIQTEFRNVHPEDYRAVALAMADLAVSSFAELPAIFRDGVDQLRSGMFNADTRSNLSVAAEELDEIYLDMQFDQKPGGRTPRWERASSLARAAFAVRFALDEDPWTAAAESTYEMIFALNDEAVLAALAAATSRDIQRR